MVIRHHTNENSIKTEAERASELMRPRGKERKLKRKMSKIRQRWPPQLFCLVNANKEKN